MIKKAQAAMEFLMTYGWAILIVLVAIASLSYFGVFKQDKFLPEACTLPTGSGLFCMDFSVGESNIALSLKNVLPNEIMITGIKFKVGNKNCTKETSQVISSDQTASIVLSGPDCSFSADEKVKGELVVEYQKTIGIPRTAAGDLVSKVASGGGASCIPSTTQPCALQDGVCSGSQDTCSSEGEWPGCDDSTYLAWNSNYENPESSCGDTWDNDCDSFGDMEDTDCCSPNCCGNGVINLPEQCDQSDLGGNSCTTLGLGYSGGTLACAGDCTFDTSNCEMTIDAVLVDAKYCIGGSMATSTSFSTRTDYTPSGRDTGGTMNWDISAIPGSATVISANLQMWQSSSSTPCPPLADPVYFYIESGLSCSKIDIVNEDGAPPGDLMLNPVPQIPCNSGFKSFDITSIVASSVGQNNLYLQLGGADMLGSLSSGYRSWRSFGSTTPPVLTIIYKSP